MTADAWGVVATLLIALLGGGWALWKWHAERRDDIKLERQRTDGLYVNPLMFAAQDLQSRLYNLLDFGGLQPLRDRERRYDIETLFLVARYFAYEMQMLRFTNLDVKLINATEAVRDALATDKAGADAWCIFRTTQNALAQSVIEWREGEVGFADTKSLVQFEELVDQGLAQRLGLDQALTSLREATLITELGPRSLRRLGDVQSALVEVLKTLEARVSTETGETFSLFPEKPRKRSKYSSRKRSTDEVSPAAPPTHPGP